MARVYFALGGELDLHWLGRQISALPAETRWQSLARGALRSDLSTLARTLAGEAIRLAPAGGELDAVLDAWQSRAAVARERYQHLLAEIRGAQSIDLAMVSVLLQAAVLAESEGISCEVIDLRSLSPIDYAPILDSVRQTGRMVYAQEAPGNVSVGSEVAATVMERAFYSLEAPVIRVSGFDTPFPPAKLEGTYLPDPDRVLEAVDRVLAY